MDLRDQLQASLGGAYTLERELGGGGMSRVFVATEGALGRKVVVKILPAELAGQVSAERFKREIALAAQLQHPHIVPLLSSGEADGLPYFTMPFVEGESLRARITRGGELPLGDAVRLLREVASALAYAHEHGVVHRDIKPDNILLSGGSAMVTDFGVAKAVSASTNADAASLTSLGVALGTPAYMSPEQASADPLIDHRADLYSFGVMAYELLTGAPPFAGRPPQAMLAAHVTETPHAVTERRANIPAPLAQLVMRCLEKRAADRPQTAKDVVQALDAITTPSGGLPPTTARVGGASAVRRTLLIATTAAVAVAAVFAWKALSPSHVSLSAQRVLVLRPTSPPNDAALAGIVELLPDVLTRALAEMSWVTPVDPGAATGEARALAARTGAGTVVSTNVVPAGDSAILQFRLLDGSTGAVVRSLAPSVVARSVNPAELRVAVDGLLSTIGFVSHPAMGPPTVPLGTPPKFIAFREFASGVALFGLQDTVSRNRSIASLHRALELDSGFVQARLWLGLSYAWYFFTSRSVQSAVRMDSARRWATVSPETATPYESALSDFVRAHTGEANDVGLDAIRRVVRLTPGSPVGRGMVTFLLDLNRPREALRQLDSNRARRIVGVDGSSVAPEVGYWNMAAEIHHSIGEHKEELEAARHARAAAPTDLVQLRAEMRALAALGDTAALRTALGEVGNVRSNDRQFGFAGDLYVTIAQELVAHGHPAMSAEFYRLGVAWTESKRDEAISRVDMGVRSAILYEESGHHAEAFAFVKEMVRRDSTDARARGYLGRLYAIQGDTASARKVLAWLESLPDAKMAGSGSYERAAILVHFGRDHWDEAIGLLEQSLRMGQGFSIRRRLHYFTDWAPLRDYPPFKRVLEPRG